MYTGLRRLLNVIIVMSKSYIQCYRFDFCNDCTANPLVQNNQTPETLFQARAGGTKGVTKVLPKSTGYPKTILN